MSVQLEWQGSYLDGQSAARQQATIRVTESGLRVTTKSGETFLWPYEEIRQTQGFYAGEQIRLERGGKLPQALLLADPAFLTSLHRLAPKLTKHFHNPVHRAMRAKLTIFAALSVAGAVAALYLWGIPAMAAFLAPRVPVSWEEHLGRAVVEHLAPPEKRCTEPSRLQAIDKIMTTLTTPLLKTPYTFRVMVVDDPTLNAFAAPGGYVVIFRGLLERTQSAEELAGVLAHEAQHILLHHAMRQLLEHASTGLIVAALAGDASGAMAYGLESARTLGLLRYSRRNEEDADSEGMKLLLAARIDPSGMIAFFELLRREGVRMPGLLEYLSTHPNTEDRIERLKALAQKPSSQPVKLLPDRDWQEVRKICQFPARQS